MFVQRAALMCREVEGLVQLIWRAFSQAAM